MRRVLAAGLSAVLFAPSAQAAEWWVVTGITMSGENPGVMFVDKSSIRPHAGYVHAWATMIMMKPFDGAYKNTHLDEVDCADKRSRIIQGISFDKDNRVVETSAIPSAWSYAAPESINEAIIDFECGVPHPSVTRLPRDATPEEFAAYYFTHK